MSVFGSSSEIGAYHIAFGGDPSGFYRTLGDVKQAADGAVSGLERKLEGLSRAASSLGRGIRASLSVVGAGIGAAAAGYIAVSAAIERSEKSSRMLGRAVGEQADEIAAFIDDIAQFAGRSEMALQRQASQIATATGLTGEQLKRAISLAVGLATEYEHMGVSGEEAARLITRAYQGDFSGLRKIGLDLDENADAMANLRAIFRQLPQWLASVRAESNTTAAGWDRLNNAGTHLAESIARVLGMSPEGGSVLSWLAGHVEQLAHWINQAKPLVDALKDSIRDLLDVGDLSNLFDAEIAILELKRLSNAVTAEVDVMGTHIDRVVRQAIQDGLDAAPAWVKRVAQGDGLEAAADAIPLNLRLAVGAPAGLIAGLWDSDVRDNPDYGLTRLNQLERQRAEFYEQRDDVALRMRQFPRLSDADIAERQHVEDNIARSEGRTPRDIRAEYTTGYYGQQARSLEHLFKTITDQISKVDAMIREIEIPTVTIDVPSAEVVELKNKQTRENAAARDAELRSQIADRSIQLVIDELLRDLQQQSKESALAFKDLPDPDLSRIKGFDDNLRNLGPMSIQTAIGEQRISDSYSQLVKHAYEQQKLQAEIRTMMDTVVGFMGQLGVI